MIALLLAVQAAGGVPADLRTRTAATIPCRSTNDRGEIVVCALRKADRYRVPFVGPEAGDPKHEPVPAQRERLLARTDNCTEKSTFLVGCGMAGVSVSSGLDGTGLKRRTPAP